MEIFSLEQRLRLSQIETLSGFKKSKLYKLISEGKFPSPIKINGGTSSRWRAGDILDYLQKTNFHTHEVGTND
jgi:predicted DNA-binding transcriptional regulator AlpA